MGSDSPQHGALRFPPIPPGTSAPSGPYLDPRTASSESGGSYIHRSGFPLLASSSYLVQAVSQETNGLLEAFVAQWHAAVDRTYRATSEETGGDEPPSPFVIFKHLYQQRGWHLWQLYWSEHQESRRSIYHTFVRVLTGE